MKPKTLFSAAAFLIMAAVTASAQNSDVKFPASSPECTLKQRVGLTDFEIVYSRPGIKGRAIYGGLVPYGEVWRTGANNATKITFNTPVKFEGSEVPAGTYALFTIPGESEWTIIINKGAQQWGAFQYDQKLDVVRVKAAPIRLGQHIETLAIEFNRIKDDSALLEIVWDDVVVPIHVNVDIGLPIDAATKTVPRIEEAIAAPGGQKPWSLYYQAAMFYYDHDLDIQKAKTWVDAAIPLHEAHYVVYLKAKILQRMGDKAGALEAAKHSKELAIKANDKGYVRLNDDLIASLQ